MSIADRTIPADMDGSIRAWEDVETRIDQIVKTSLEPFDSSTIANTRDLLAVCQGGTRAFSLLLDFPKQLGSGVFFAENAHEGCGVGLHPQGKCFGLPTSVGKGYWSTVCLSWSQFQIEVFEDRFEVYHFYDQSSEIWYEEHKPGGAFTSRFLAELNALSARSVD